MSADAENAKLRAMLAEAILLLTTAPLIAAQDSETIENLIELNTDFGKYFEHLHEWYPKAKAFLRKQSPEHRSTQ